jgi:hypothetical protein
MNSSGANHRYIDEDSGSRNHRHEARGGDTARLPEMCRKGWRVAADADEFLDKVGGY